MKTLGKQIIAALLFLAMLSAFFFLFINGIKPDDPPKMTKAEMEAADLTATPVSLNSGVFDWYPERLYSPGDFAAHAPTPGKGPAMFGTYRITLKIPKGKTYGITGLTCSYAQRVYVNGALLSAVGNVADNPRDFVPRADSYSVFFTPQTDETEIIIQLAHWNNQNGYFNRLSLGEQKLIVATNRAKFLSAGLIIGTLITFAAFFFGMFLFYPVKRHLLWFAIVCFLSGVYFFVFENKDIMVLFPNLPWAVSHKLEYMCQFGTHIFLIAFVISMLKMKPHKWLAAGFWSVVGGIALYYILAPSTFYSYHNVLPIFIYSAAILAATLYILRKAIKSQFFKYRENLIVISCLLLDIGAYLFDMATSRNHNVLPFATILLIFFEAIAITMQFSRTEKELNLAQLREKEISETNTMLARMSRLKSDFLHTVAHEMKTPLTVMSGFAQITDWQIQDGAVDETASSNLKNIYAEAGRLSAMVERLSELAFGNELTVPKEKVSARELLKHCADLCVPVAHKNDNTLKTDCESDLYLYANRDSILQVLFNLIVNANKHTTNGDIKISVKGSDGFASFTVEDDGTGIAPELLPNIFEKGVSGDAGSGLGLAISREIIEENDGMIELEHTGTDGTCFRFTIPLWKEGQQ